MNAIDARDIIASLPSGKTRFNYFKDYYAAMLLKEYIGEHSPIAKIQRSPFCKLLERPLIKPALTQAGNRILTRRNLESLSNPLSENYLLTLGMWGNPDKGYDSWYQTSRAGYNLVLQLNFSEKHNRVYYNILNDRSKCPFSYGCHPTRDDDVHR
ncbi:hypothetical protein JYT61_01300, partial [bacterium AH-315-E10]|nr:hypothetical protein [bacterium AH-315-E10]